MFVCTVACSGLLTCFGLLVLLLLLLPPAGKIEFGVITQSSSAFNHILNDVSLVVYQVRLWFLQSVRDAESVWF
jgi:ABC-type uncharacterized transport system fused permease/ATPase subunit